MYDILKMITKLVHHGLALYLCVVMVQVTHERVPIVSATFEPRNGEASKTTFASELLISYMKIQKVYLHN